MTYLQNREQLHGGELQSLPESGDYKSWIQICKVELKTSRRDRFFRSLAS